MRLLNGDRTIDRLLPPAPGQASQIVLLSAVMAFFAVIALALALAAGRLEQAWDPGQPAAATLEIVAPDDEVEAQARAALAVLRATSGVLSVRVVEIDEQRRLLEPWLGAEVPADSLPLPLVIEVLTAGDRLDVPALERRLAAEAPGAVFDDHAAWRLPLSASAGRLELFAFVCLGTTALALAAVVGLAAQAALAASGTVIQTMRLVGARDAYIADAFTRRLSRWTCAGSLVGTVAGAAVLATLPTGNESGFFLVGIGPVGWDWAFPVAVPLAAVTVAWIVARQATLRALRRWT